MPVNQTKTEGEKPSTSHSSLWLIYKKDKVEPALPIGLFRTAHHNFITATRSVGYGPKCHTIQKINSLVWPISIIEFLLGKFQPKQIQLNLLSVSCINKTTNTCSDFSGTYALDIGDILRSQVLTQQTQKDQILKWKIQLLESRHVQLVNGFKQGNLASN